MNYCEMRMGTVDPEAAFLVRISNVCGKPASCKVRGHWYCEECADTVEDLFSDDETDEYGYADAGDIE